MGSRPETGFFYFSFLQPLFRVSGGSPAAESTTGKSNLFSGTCLKSYKLQFITAEFVWHWIKTP
jgi:hypothetical protein